MKTMNDAAPNTSAWADEMDSRDPLGAFRDRFHFPKANNGQPIYFMGNSLGLMPKTAREYVDQELDDWATLGVDAHLKAKNPWLPYHEFLTESMARIIGAGP